jgi:hypothetical protein
VSGTRNSVNGMNSSCNVFWWHEKIYVDEEFFDDFFSIANKQEKCIIKVIETVKLFVFLPLKTI